MAQQLFSILSLYHYDTSLFDGASFPASLDRESVIDSICLACAELELLYPDAETMKRAITIWSNKNAYTWNKLEETLFYDYNPIWNKDGVITEEREINTHTEGQTENALTGFNTSSFQNADKMESDANGHTDESYKRIEQGNIGITSTQQLIKEQREIVSINLTDIITESFKEAFCLLVY